MDSNEFSVAEGFPSKRNWKAVLPNPKESEEEGCSLGWVCLFFCLFSVIKFSYSLRNHLTELLGIMGCKQRHENQGSRTEYGKGHSLKFRHERNSDKMHRKMPLQNHTKHIKGHAIWNTTTNSLSGVTFYKRLLEVPVFMEKSEAEHYNESGTATSQASWVCVAYWSCFLQDRILLLLSSLNKLKVREQQCHEITSVIILICTTTCISFVRIKQSKPNVGIYIIKLLRLRNGCWFHLSLLVQTQDISILMSKEELADYWAGHYWIRNHIICDLEKMVFFHPALENIKADFLRRRTLTDASRRNKEY